MGPEKLLCLIFISFMVGKDALSIESRNLNRQKRCIVVQKQSGTHGDSTEGGGEDDEEYKEPMNKDPKPDKRRRVALKDFDVEKFSVLPSKYKILPTKWLNRNLRPYNKKYY